MVEKCEEQNEKKKKNNSDGKPFFQQLNKCSEFPLWLKFFRLGKLWFIIYIPAVHKHHRDKPGRVLNHKKNRYYCSTVWLWWCKCSWLPAVHSPGTIQGDVFPLKCYPNSSFPYSSQGLGKNIPNTVLFPRTLLKNPKLMQLLSSEWIAPV